MTALDDKINEHFAGLVVRKDLVKAVKGNAIVPSYVLEYLLGQYCATNDEASIETGIETVKDILCKKANGGEIPATVTNFDFNDEFIIAKQKPKLPQDPLYDNNYKYNRGDKEYYYWIIIKM